MRPTHDFNILTKATFAMRFCEASLRVEDGVVVRPAHLLQKKLEPPLAHVFALVFVLAELGEGEFTHAGPHPSHELL